MLCEKRSDLPRGGPAAGRGEVCPPSPGLAGRARPHLEGRRR